MNNFCKQLFGKLPKRASYFIAYISETDHQLKFYDLADGKIKNPPNVDTNVFAVKNDALLCPVSEQTSRLMIAELP